MKLTKTRRMSVCMQNNRHDSSWFPCATWNCWWRREKWPSPILKSRPSLARERSARTRSASTTTACPSRTRPLSAKFRRNSTSVPCAMPTVVLRKNLQFTGASSSSLLFVFTQSRYTKHNFKKPTAMRAHPCGGTLVGMLHPRSLSPNFSRRPGSRPLHRSGIKTFVSLLLSVHFGPPNRGKKNVR